MGIFILPSTTFQYVHTLYNLKCVSLSTSAANEALAVSPVCFFFHVHYGGDFILIITIHCTQSSYCKITITVKELKYRNGLLFCNVMCFLQSNGVVVSFQPSVSGYTRSQCMAREMSSFRLSVIEGYGRVNVNKITLQLQNLMKFKNKTVFVSSLT